MARRQENEPRVTYYEPHEHHDPDRHRLKWKLYKLVLLSNGRLARTRCRDRARGGTEWNAEVAAVRERVRAHVNRRER